MVRRVIGILILDSCGQDFYLYNFSGQKISLRINYKCIGRIIGSKAGKGKGMYSTTRANQTYGTGTQNHLLIELDGNIDIGRHPASFVQRLGTQYLWPLVELTTNHGVFAQTIKSIAGKSFPFSSWIKGIVGI